MTRAWKWLGDQDNPKQFMRIADYFSLKDSYDKEEVSEWYFSGVDPAIKEKASKFRVPDFYRTLSQYFNTLINAGFAVTQLQEPFATEEKAKAVPGVADTRNIPYFLIFQCRKTNS